MLAIRRNLERAAQVQALRFWRRENRGIRYWNTTHATPMLRAHFTIFRKVLLNAALPCVAPETCLQYGHDMEMLVPAGLSRVSCAINCKLSPVSTWVVMGEGEKSDESVYKLYQLRYSSASSLVTRF